MHSDEGVSRTTALALAFRLRKYRDQAMLTQEEAAWEVGVSRNYYQLMEAGLSNRRLGTHMNPKLSTLLAIAKAFGITLDELVADLPLKNEGRNIGDEIVIDPEKVKLHAREPLIGERPRGRVAAG